MFPFYHPKAATGSLDDIEMIRVFYHAVVKTQNVTDQLLTLFPAPSFNIRRTGNTRCTAFLFASTIVGIWNQIPTI